MKFRSAIMVFFMLISAAAGAQSPKQAAKEYFQKASQSYKLGKFEQALDLYSKAYETLPLPAFLFNIGQCHRQLGNHERAVFFFEGYLRDADNAGNRDVVEELIATSKEAIAEEEQRKAEEARKAEEERRRAEDARMELMMRQETARQEAARNGSITLPPLLREWWFWTAVGAVVVVGGGTAVALTTGGKTIVMPPEGSIGSIDRR